MGRFHVVLSDDTEKRLRNTLPQRKKGDLSAAIEEAVKDWLKTHGSH